MSGSMYSQSSDTVTVQTFTFGSPQEAWFVFPSDTVRFEKILMLYTLKCNPAQNPACGEWDYLTYTYLYDHTGLTDSAIVHQPVFTVNANTVDSFMYVNAPTYSYQGNWQYSIIHNLTNALNTYSLGNGVQQLEKPFGASSPVSRSQYLFKASELVASGMGAGDISGLRFNIPATGSLLKNLTIRMKQTTLDSLHESTFENTGFTELYRQHTQFPGTGWQSLQFVTPFNWNGSSNIILEITYDNNASGTDNLALSSDAGFSTGLTRSGSDRAMAVHGGAYAHVPVNDHLKQIDSLITIAFWAYGDATLQPQDGSCFEGVDSSSNRVVNAHVPWSDSNVYWDCGNDGGSYDRISKAATADNIKGRWNHWAFTKNVGTGSMKIYLNGVQWHSGTAKLRSMKEIRKFYIGKGTWNGAQSYEGQLDEFAVFNTELNLAEVQDVMLHGVKNSSPLYNNLVLYYSFDDGSYVSATDSAPGNHAPALFTAIGNPLKKASDYVYGLTQTPTRPDVVFEQGSYTSHTDSLFIVDSLINVPAQVVSYADSMNNPGIPVDTLFLWKAGYYNPIYGSTGLLNDSVFIPPDSMLVQTYYDFYRKFPQVIRYELARYITPYGNGLSLGNGWTWTFDVTDYRTLLSDSVHISAGNWQELLDMKFVMIKGTPPRDVVSIQNLWNGGFNYGQTADPIESHLTPKKVYIPANAVTARWKSRITGHGMDSPQNCAEFCAKNHYFKVNDSLRYTQLVWRDNCDLNPLYPQGGTWVYDRANWCPGAEVWTYNFELTPFITPGDSLTLDHDVQPYTNTSGWDYYQIEDQLVCFGPPNFTLDAAIENVLSPTQDQMWSRHNPVCTKPTVVIKNNGSTNLTSLTISYGITGSTLSVYNWTGLLKFGETATVELDSFAWMQGASTFTVNICSPNGGVDQYQQNNTRVTPFTYVPVMPPKFVIEFKTNNYPYQNSYTLTDVAGNEVWARSNLTANTTYKDTLELSDGCYIFRLTDTGENGLTWWANTAQGSGSIRFRSATSPVVLKNFNADFGGEVYMQFTVGLTSQVDDYIFTKVPVMNVYPNPAEDVVNIDFDLPSRESGSIEIWDMYGKHITTLSFEDKVAHHMALNGNIMKTGVYFITLRTEAYTVSKKLIFR